MKKKIILSTILFAGCCSGFTAAKDSTLSIFTPSLNVMSSRGLNQIYSAEPVGEGRLSITLSSAWYSQEKEFDSAPNKGTNVGTGMLSVCFGVSSFFDIFTSLSGYGLGGYTKDSQKGGIGTFRGGIQGRLPLSESSPVYLGTRISILAGTSSNQVNSHAADGYNYFETRTGYDFEGILLQTFRIGKEGRCVKFHLNEGGVMTLQQSKDQLLILGGGFQVDPYPVVTIGVEVNSRTSMSDLNFRTDPLWISPVLQFHTPFNMEFSLGSDFALSKERTDSTRSLEPFRLFGSIGWSFDVLASKRRMLHEKETNEQIAREKEHKQREAAESKNVELQAKADSITWKAHNDSLKLVQLRELERSRADSIAAKAKADSIQLVEARKSLEEEKSKRSDAEKQLLSTGLLLLDAVYFESGKSDISINSEPYLMIISKMLLKYPKLQVEVAGHTDNVGSITKNMSLSQTRADAVKYFLIQSSPQLASRLTARGYGPIRPKSNNSYAEGRKVNRRVELQVLNKEVLSEYNR
jgi:outer membrane protein OmpA-like peptidoglycan-associated protein